MSDKFFLKNQYNKNTYWPTITYQKPLELEKMNRYGQLRLV